MIKSETGKSLGELLEHGGIYYALPGNSVHEVLEAFIKTIPVQSVIPLQDLLTAVLEREALMSTSIGRGIAIPHPRNPFINGQEEQFAALGFLDHKIDWNALDGNPVDTLILTVSATAQLHLKILSSITFFSRQDKFIRLLRERASPEEIIRYIKDTEKEWRQ